MNPVPEKPTQFYDNFLPALDAASESGFDFLSDVAIADLESLSISCGADVSSFLNFIVAFQETLTGTRSRTEGMIELMFCSNFNTIYVEMLHNNICNPGVTDVAIISFSLISATVCAMVMITMRISWNDENAGKDGTKVDKSEKPSRSSSLGADLGAGADVEGPAIARSASDETENENQKSELQSQTSYPKPEQRLTNSAETPPKQEKSGFGWFKTSKKKNSEEIEEETPPKVDEQNVSFDVNVEESGDQGGVEAKVL